MERIIFKDFDFTDFWDDNEYAMKEYVEDYPSDDLISSIEQELGYKLPASYIELMKLHNGGIPKNSCHPTSESTSWAEDHVAITGIMGIGRTKTYSLSGSLGSKFMIDEWGYPNTGVFICDCPSAGHDMIMLDYSNCGKDGEPEVVHVDQEIDYKKTFLAKNFETFIRGLVKDEVYRTSEQGLTNTFEILKTERLNKKDINCNCDDFRPLELISEQISTRIKESKKIQKTLDYLAESKEGNILYQCNCCGQYWQESFAWNWGRKTYLFKVPETSIEDWQEEQFMSPADMFMYLARMSDYFTENKLRETEKKCRIEDCDHKAIEGAVLCKKHFIENLQKVNLLPKAPSGKIFEPYSFYLMKIHWLFPQ